MLRCSSWGGHRFVVGTMACVVFPIPAVSFAAPAGAYLLTYDPFTVGAGPADYTAGDENAETDLLGGQNPATGPAAFYSGPWVQSGGDTQVVKNIGSLLYPHFPQNGGQVGETVPFMCGYFGARRAPSPEIPSLALGMDAIRSRR